MNGSSYRSRSKAFRVACLAALAGSTPGMVAAATAHEPGFIIEPYLGPLGKQDTLTAIAFAPDGALFIAEKNGQLRVLPPGASSPRAFATIGVFSDRECGLLGVALHPEYSSFGTGGHVFVFATTSTTEQRIVRFRDEGGVGVERTEIKTGLPTMAFRHNGGCLRIGPDGKFYFAIGDGGGVNERSQDVTNLFGKVMRLNLDGSVPPDNPDLSSIDPGYRPEILAYGFRNPFRLALRLTGPATSDFQVFANDVGSGGNNRREEVNLVQPGKNHGWPKVEGIAGDPRYVDPVYAYGGAAGSAITGGIFYQGGLFPATHKGNFFYMEYVMRKIYRVVLEGDAVSSHTLFADTPEGGPVDIAEGPDGALYYTTHNGRIFRIGHQSGGNRNPTAVLRAAPEIGAIPLSVDLDATASTDVDGRVVRFDWDFGDGAALPGGPAQLTHLYDRAGTYIARVAVTDDQDATSSAIATIQALTEVDLEPSVEILAPLPGASYDAGATVELLGRGVDPEDGPLDGSNLRWEVILHHNEHTHPWLDGLSGSSESFDIPAEGLEEGWSFRIVLTGADSRNQAATAERIVDLNYEVLRLDSDPPGLRLTADGVSLFTPAQYRGVNKAQVELDAPSPQSLRGEPYHFARWSDGGGQSHSVTASAGLLFRAIFGPGTDFFLRGDANRDSAVDISDVVYTLSAMFISGEFWSCPDAADANDDGDLDISDPVITLHALFKGMELPGPWPKAGFDTTADNLVCESAPPPG